MPWFKSLLKKDNKPEIYAGDDAQKQMVPEDDEDEAQLALDIFQDKDNVIVKSTVAGVKPEDLDISLSNDSVTIRGERKNEEQISEDDYFYQECFWGGFSRTVRLPVEVDPDKADADLKDGVLVLTIPKASKSRTRKVKIRGEE